MPTIAQTLERARTRLSASPSARTDAEELVSRLVGMGRTEIHLHPERAITAADAARLDGWLARRVAGEPVQYITGRAAFYGLDLAVNPAVLVPRPETEGLVEAVLRALRHEASHWPRPRVLDLGTGS